MYQRRAGLSRHPRDHGTGPETPARRVVVALAAAGLLAGAAALTACGTTPGPSAGPTTDVVTKAAEAAGPADPPLPPPPAKTAGPLTAANLPPAGRIGPAFKPYVEPDSAEDGVVSNGAAVRSRDPKQLAEAIGPLGCPGLDALAPLPVPARALEQTYRTPQQLSAVALVLEYPTEAAATGLVNGLASRLAACTAPASTARLTMPRLVAEVRRPDPMSLYDSRREVGPDAAPTEWDETVVRMGRRVSLVIIERMPDAPEYARTTLVSELRARMGR